MKRKLLISLIILSLVLVVLPVQAAKAITVIIDGETQSYTQPPVIIKGSTLVPLRGIFESLGATVSWNGETKTVTATSGKTNISLTIGSVDTTVNGETIKISVPAQIINKSTMVPLRFVSEALGASVSWDGKTRSVVISNEPVKKYPELKINPEKIGMVEKNEPLKVDKTPRIYDFNGNYTSYQKIDKENRTVSLITEEEYKKIHNEAIKCLNEVDNKKEISNPALIDTLQKYQYIYFHPKKDGENEYYLFDAITARKGLWGTNLENDNTIYLSFIENNEGETNPLGVRLKGNMKLYPVIVDKADPNLYYEKDYDFLFWLEDFERDSKYCHIYEEFIYPNVVGL